MAIPQIPPIPAANFEPQLDTPEQSANDYFAGVQPIPQPQQLGPSGDPYGWVPEEWNPHPAAFAPELGGIDHPNQAPGADDWVPDEWKVGQPGASGPNQFVGHDVPEVQGGNALAQQHQPQAAPPAAPANAAKPMPAAPGGAPGAGAPSAEEAYLAQERETAKKHAEAIQEQANAEKAKSAYVAEQTIAANNEARDRINDAEKARNQYAIEAKNRTAELDKEAQKIASTKLDQGRIFKSAGMLGELGLGITAFLAGASTASINSGKNPILDMMDDMMARDLQAQQSDLANRREMLGQRRGLAAEATAQGQNDVEAKYRYSTSVLELAKNQIIAGAAQFDNPRIDAQAKEALATLNDRLASNALTLTQYNEKRAFEEWQAKQQIGIQRGHLGLANRQFEYGKKHDEDVMKYQYDELASRAADRDAAAKAAGSKAAQEHQDKLDEKRIHLGAMKDGSPLYAPDAETARDVNKKIGYTNNLYRKVARLNEIYEKHHWQLTNLSDDEKEAKEILTELPALYSNANHQGVVHPEEYKQYEALWGKDPSSIIDPRARWRSLQNQLEQDMNGELRARVNRDSAYWKADGLPDDKAGFTEGGDAKKLPAPTGVGNSPDIGEVSPQEQDLINSGKFKPSDRTGQQSAPAPVAEKPKFSTTEKQKVAPEGVVGPTDGKQVAHGFYQAQTPTYILVHSGESNNTAVIPYDEAKDMIAHGFYQELEDGSWVDTRQTEAGGLPARKKK